jgi:hypothetical protein
LFLPKLVFEVVDEGTLVVGVGCAVGVEDEDAVGLDEDAEVEEVD